MRELKRMQDEPGYVSEWRPKTVYSTNVLQNVQHAQRLFKQAQPYKITAIYCNRTHLVFEVNHAVKNKSAWQDIFINIRLTGFY